MKFLIFLSIIFVLVTVNAGASIIILKDGQTITGTIIQQDKAKVVVNVGGDSLTYYKDEIVSMKDEPLIKKGDNTGPDADKRKLVEQYWNLIRPTSEVVSEWVRNAVTPDRQQTVLSFLNEEKNILALTKFRSQVLMKYLSSSELKAAINFYSSPEGRQYVKDIRRYQYYVEPKIVSIFKKATEKTVGKGK
jgi:hypothetical protein